MRYFETLEKARSLRRNQTKAETEFWSKVRGRKFNGLKFNRQHIIEYTQILNQKLFYIADFHCFELQLIIELDGGMHLDQVDYDIERQNNIEAIGYKVIRFSNDIVLNNWETVEYELLKLIIK